MSETQAVSETCFTRSNRQTRKQHQTDKQTDRHVALIITRISLLKFMQSECKFPRPPTPHTHTHAHTHTHTPRTYIHMTKKYFYKRSKSTVPWAVINIKHYITAYLTTVTHCSGCVSVCVYV